MKVDRHYLCAIDLNHMRLTVEESIMIGIREGQYFPRHWQVIFQIQ